MRINVLSNFEKIDNEEKAYWLGFLYADGSIGSSDNRIELGLAERDLEQIKKFKKFLNIENKIQYREKTKSYRIQVKNKKCKEDLVKQGCVPKKSLILNFPTEEQVPKELIRHFIRGYFDGDGWFTNTEKCFQVGIIGTESFINGFLNILEQKNINNKNKIFDVHRKDGAKRYILNAYQDVLNFLNYIYQDANIFLDRKFSHYLDFKNNGSKYHKTKNADY